MDLSRNEAEWWMPEYEFFGNFYIEGDNSCEGYLENRKQTLQERVETEVNGIIRLLNLQDNARILDLPCGYGRHSIELAKKGFIVTGCDLNPTHLSTAKKRSREICNLSFVTGNMLNYRAQHSFDAVINMFYSFGFFENEEDNLETLRNFYENLAPGGKFLFHTDVNLMRVSSGKYREYEERQLSNGNKLIIVDKYDPITRRINGNWTIKNGSKEIVKTYSVRVYTAQEFTDLCEEINFKNLQFFGDWDGNPYSENSEDMIVVAEKI